MQQTLAAAALSAIMATAAGAGQNADECVYDKLESQANGLSQAFGVSSENIFVDITLHYDRQYLEGIIDECEFATGSNALTAHGLTKFSTGSITYIFE